jgi:hypothetical protein
MPQDVAGMEAPCRPKRAGAGNVVRIVIRRTADSSRALRRGVIAVRQLHWPMAIGGDIEPAAV